MNLPGLLEKLIALERAVGTETPIDIRRRVIEIEEYVLKLQGDAVQGSRSSKGAVERFSLYRDMIENK